MVYNHDNIIPIIPVGVDIETTGLEIGKHRLIQIGITFGGKREYCFDVKPKGDMVIDQSALDINHFTLARIGLGGFQKQIDDILYEELSPLSPASLTPVGWNVGSFDIPFIKLELPKTAAFFSHRVIDLTGISYLSAALHKTDQRSVKDNWHGYAAMKLGIKPPKWHDALYDAQAAMKVWEGLTNGDLLI